MTPDPFKEYHTYRSMVSTASHSRVVVRRSQDQQIRSIPNSRQSSRLVQSQRRVAVLSRSFDHPSYSMGQCISVGGEGRGRRGLRTTARAAAQASGEPMKVMIAGAPGTCVMFGGRDRGYGG